MGRQRKKLDELDPRVKSELVPLGEFIKRVCVEGDVTTYCFAREHCDIPVNSLQSTVHGFSLVSIENAIKLCNGIYDLLGIKLTIEDIYRLTTDHQILYKYEDRVPPENALSKLEASRFVSKKLLTIGEDIVTRYAHSPEGLEVFAEIVERAMNRNEMDWPELSKITGISVGRLQAIIEIQPLTPPNIQEINRLREINGGLNRLGERYLLTLQDCIDMIYPTLLEDQMTP